MDFAAIFSHMNGYAGLVAVCAAATAMGILAHVLYFIRGCRIREASRIAIGHGTVFTAISAECIGELSLGMGLLVASAVVGSYLAGLFGSMTVYRLYFHPLRDFPGPTGAKVSNLYNVWVQYTRTLHVGWAESHQKYGDIVRIGPGVLSIVRMDAIAKIHGAASKCEKAGTGIYDFVHIKGEQVLGLQVDRAEHRRRRKAWAPIALKTSVGRLEPKIRQVVVSWIEMLGEHAQTGDVVDLTDLSYMLTWENMGNIGFSHGFGAIKNRSTRGLISTLQRMSAMQEIVSGVGWPLGIVFDLPSFWLRKLFDDTAEELVENRLKRDCQLGSDIIGYLIRDYLSDKPVSYTNKARLAVDAQGIMMGSTGTLGCTVSYVLGHLADPKIRCKVRSAVRPAFGKTCTGEFRDGDLEAIPYLNGVVNEAMRLHSPATANGPRTTPPEGLMIDDVWVPGGTTIYTSAHVYFEDERFFKLPREFIPERWTTRPELVIEKKAFFPFTIG